MATQMARWRPISDLGDLWERFDQALAGFGDGGGWSPRIDVVKRESEIIVRADVPGVKPEEIDVEVEDGILTLSGEHEEKIEEKEERYLRRERRYGSFSRSMTLPEGVKADDIEATSTDGVLELRVPLPKPEQKPKRTVKIKTR